MIICRATGLEGAAWQEERAHVDGEMGINGSHLVEETLCDADDHVFDQRLDGSKAGVVLALAVPHYKLDLAAFGRLDHSASAP
jgi:hypothetical protein